MRVALIPLKVLPRAPQTNLRRLQKRLEEAAAGRPDLVCLPECTLSGYLYTEEDFARFAEPIPGETTRQVGDLARPYRFHLCFGLLERAPEGVYDTAVLMDGAGRVLHLHRKNNEKPPFLKGREVRAVDTALGRLGILICGDLFSEEVVARLDRRVRLLIVPLARSFAGRSPDRARWEREERQVYLEAVRRVGLPTVLVNALEEGQDPSFGGAMVVGADGEVLAESPHGSDALLLYDLP